jgi:hypothetical protein
VVDLLPTRDAGIGRSRLVGFAFSGISGLVESPSRRYERIYSMSTRSFIATRPGRTVEP